MVNSLRDDDDGHLSSAGHRSSLFASSDAFFRLWYHHATSPAAGAGAGAGAGGAVGGWQVPRRQFRNYQSLRLRECRLRFYRTGSQVSLL